jgi:hypothetical protein
MKRKEVEDTGNKGDSRVANKLHRTRLQRFKYVLEEERNRNRGSGRGLKGCIPKAMVQKDKVAAK